jgi:hypothetical protein
VQAPVKFETVLNLMSGGQRGSFVINSFCAKVPASPVQPLTPRRHWCRKASSEAPT